MGKKRFRKKLTSKRIHSNVNRGVLQAIRSERSYLTKLENISRAWKKLLNPWITIENPDKSATNKKFIRVRTNDYWGNPKFTREG